MHAIRLDVNQRLTQMDLATSQGSPGELRKSGGRGRRKSMEVGGVPQVTFRAKYIMAADTFAEKEEWIRCLRPSNLPLSPAVTPRSTRHLLSPSGVLSPAGSPRARGMLSPAGTPREVLADDALSMLRGFSSVEEAVDALENQLYEEYRQPSSTSRM